MLWGIHSASSALPTPHKDDEIDPGDDQIEFGEGFEELDDILSMVALTEEAPTDGGDATEGAEAAGGAKEGAASDAMPCVADATADGSEKSVVVPTVAIAANSEETSGEQGGDAASQGEDTQPPMAVPIPAVSPRKRKQFVAPPSSAPRFRSVGGLPSGDAGAKPSRPPVAPRPKPSFAPPPAPTPAADQEAPVADVAVSTGAPLPSPTTAPLPTPIPAPPPGKPAAGAGISPPAAQRVAKSTSAPVLPPAPVGEPKDTGDAERKPVPPAARGGPPQKPVRPPPKAGARPPPGRMNARPPKPTFGGSSGNLRRPPKPALPKLAPKPSEG